MEIQYRSHIKDKKSVTFIATTNPVTNIPRFGLNVKVISKQDK